jgi:uncharacterized protein (DUF58 family)
MTRFDRGDAARAARALRVRARRDVSTSLTGAYRSAFRGQGLTFEELRDYVPGDDVRWLEWNATARTGRPIVKRMREERDVVLALLVDLSPSLEFGFSTATKLEAVRRAAAALAAAATAAQDRVALAIFAQGLVQVLPPTSGRPALEGVFRALEAPCTGAFTDAGPALGWAAEKLPRNSVVALISDFFPDPGARLRRCASKHDLVRSACATPPIGRPRSAADPCARRRIASRTAVAEQPRRRVRAGRSPARGELARDRRRLRRALDGNAAPAEPAALLRGARAEAALRRRERGAVRGRTSAVACGDVPLDHARNQRASTSIGAKRASAIRSASRSRSRRRQLHAADPARRATAPSPRTSVRRHHHEGGACATTCSSCAREVGDQTSALARDPARATRRSRTAAARRGRTAGGALGTRGPARAYGGLRHPHGSADRADTDLGMDTRRRLVASRGAAAAPSAQTLSAASTKLADGDARRSLAGRRDGDALVRGAARAPLASSAALERDAASATPAELPTVDRELGASCTRSSSRASRSGPLAPLLPRVKARERVRMWRNRLKPPTSRP